MANRTGTRIHCRGENYLSHCLSTKQSADGLWSDWWSTLRGDWWTFRRLVEHSEATGGRLFADSKEHSVATGGGFGAGSAEHWLLSDLSFLFSSMSLAFSDSRLRIFSRTSTISSLASTRSRPGACCDSFAADSSRIFAH